MSPTLSCTRWHTCFTPSWRNMFDPRKSLAASVLALSAVCAVAQTPDTATLSGTVQDASSALVSGASITATNTLTGVTRTTITDSRGRYSMVALPIAGSYTVSVAKDGFAPTETKGVILSAGAFASVGFSLNVQATGETVTVKGVASDVVLNQPEIGIRLSSGDIESTPLLNRRITNLVNLNAANRPAINQGDIFMNQNLFTTNGGGRRQGSFDVDGANGNDSWGRQTIFTNIPEDAVQEMDVLANSFDAEYGGSTGSVINIVTRSGGNTLHGSLLGLYRPGNLGAQYDGFTPTATTSGNQIAHDQLNQYAYSLGGKLTPTGKTHFFVAGEFSQQRRGSQIANSALTPGVFQGHYRDFVEDVRIDHQLSSKNNAFLKINADGFYDTNPNGIVGGSSLASVARTFYRRTYSIEGGDTAIITSSLVNNLRLQFQLASPITQFIPVVYGTQYSVPIAGAPTFTSGTSQSALLLNHQYGVNEVLSLTRGKQEIVAGGDWLLAHTGGDSKEFGGPYFLGRFVYNTCSQAGDTVAQLEAYCESSAYLNNIANVATYTQGFGNPNYTVNDNLFAAFVQDNYKATRKLTLNLGLRYEQQTFTDSRLNFAPRVGFVADPFGDGSTILRGGFGIYYSQVVDNEQATYVLSGPAYVNFTATPGQVGFPTSVASAPLPALLPGAPVPVRQIYLRPGAASNYTQYFDPTKLVGYPGKLQNPYSEQYTLGVEQRLLKNTVLAIDYVGTHTLHITRPLDVDAPTSFIRTAQGQTRTAAAADCTRPLWIAYYAAEGLTCTTTSARSTQPNFDTIQTDSANGFLHYDALDVNLKHNWGAHGSMRISYVWSHTLDNVDPDTTSQNPNDANFSGRNDYANAIFDQRSRFVASGDYVAPFKIHIGGVLTLAGGLPYNLVTGATNSGDTGATTDRPVINGVVVGRNTQRGAPIYQFDPFFARAIHLYERLNLDLRAEAFNALNHQNFVAFNGTYGNNAAAPATLGTPTPGITGQLTPRELQFSARLSF